MGLGGGWDEKGDLLSEHTSVKRRLIDSLNTLAVFAKVLQLGILYKGSNCSFLGNSWDKHVTY